MRNLFIALAISVFVVLEFVLMIFGKGSNHGILFGDMNHFLYSSLLES